MENTLGWWSGSSCWGGDGSRCRDSDSGLRRWDDDSGDSRDCEANDSTGDSGERLESDDSSNTGSGGWVGKSGGSDGNGDNGGNGGNGGNDDGRRGLICKRRRRVNDKTIAANHTFPRRR